MTQNSKLNITVACGGVSTEHAISIISAKNVIQALDKNKYQVNVLYIHEKGAWYWMEDAKLFAQSHHPASLIETGQLKSISPFLGQRHTQQSWLSLESHRVQFPVDCVIPILHGTEGEDGTIQGLFELMDVPYVGAGVLSSAICMDKDITKRLLRSANIETTPWQTFASISEARNQYKVLSSLWNTPILFVKPASLGSSVGISRVSNKEEFDQAIAEAFQYDHFVMAEPSMNAREIECAVLGNGTPRASVPGEIIVSKEKHSFYSYVAKYHDPEAAKTIVPAQLSEEIVQQTQTIAIQAFKALRCTGMARVDFFFLEQQKKLIINEINTIPGFTQISLYPKMWEASGMPYAELLDNLIALALQRYQHQQSLLRVYNEVGIAHKTND